MPLMVFGFFLAAGVSAFAQEAGKVSGLVVSSWDGTPLPAVVITVRGTTLAAQTDSTGRYQLNNVPPGDQVLRFSKSGYASIVVTDVRVLLGQTTTVNGNLRPEFFELEEYEYTAEEITEETGQILFDRQKSSALMDNIGSEQFSKLGVDDAGGALSKVSGASLADGKFAVIRGLADRYTSTTFNGVDIPSADPDRRAVQLDLFPAKFINRIDVSKTFSPDIPGGFAGGAINIVPRNIPDKFEFELEAGVSYNTKASLRDDFPITDQGSTDWLAMDDGKRALPAIAEASNPAGQAEINNPAFKNSFGSRRLSPAFGDSPLNSSFFLGIGDSHKFFGGRLGYLAGLTYKNSYESRDDLRVTQYQSGGSTIKVDKTNNIQGLIEYTWSALVSLGYEISENHELGFNFMYVQTAEDEATRLRGYHGDVVPEDSSGYLDQSILKWTERNLTYYQLRGDHQFEELRNVRLDWAGAIASTSQDEPDARIFQFFADPEGELFNPDGTVEPTKPFRSFRFLEEGITSGRVGLTVPVPSYTSEDNFFKTGLFYSHSERNLNQRAFSAITRGFSHPFVRGGDPEDYLAAENQRFIFYQNYSQAYRHEGQQTIGAWYLMGDWHALEWLRLTGGARKEQTELTVDTINLTRNGEASGSAIKRDDLLPSLAATISIRSNLLLRAAWSDTVIRPTYREISPAFEIDAVRGRLFSGNPGLTFSASRNYDLRLEWYPRPNSLMAVSLFKKEISGPIERTSIGTDNVNTTFTNYPTADVVGGEIELRENLGSLWKPLNVFTLGFNAAYIQSEVGLTPDQRKIRGQVWNDEATTRPLYDQPEFILNGDLTWEHKGTRITVSGGVVGRRLILVGLAEPDDFEEPTPQLDVFVTQKLGKHWKAKLSARNLLDPVYDVTQDWPKGRLPVESYTRGMTFGFSLGCEF